MWKAHWDLLDSLDGRCASTHPPDGTRSWYGRTHHHHPVPFARSRSESAPFGNPCAMTRGDPPNLWGGASLDVFIAHKWHGRHRVGVVRSLWRKPPKAWLTFHHVESTGSWWKAAMISLFHRPGSPPRSCGHGQLHQEHRWAGKGSSTNPSGSRLGHGKIPSHSRARLDYAGKKSIQPPWLTFYCDKTEGQTHPSWAFHR